MAHCVALLSGGMDSMLAVRLMQQHGVQVDAVYFRGPFACDQQRPARRRSCWACV